ncbi:hypothetical protein OG280_40590 [Streptomyces virginiae]|uniref:hypothetical protein n=1 Tax=Streptomyces virginiae TaxID=1961 RepID=UPI002DD9954D|nr:hypothetical protein [Streptomyces virginiae]WSC74872.1 hypothetical protein OHA56_00195 [Streptomyces virginiae]WSC82125.1 hypothetical protein OHA56_40600 [Streptomyces virginiae]
MPVGPEQMPDGDGEDEGWSGQEPLDRYPPGRAATVIGDTFGTGTPGHSTVSVTGADVRADDHLVLRTTTTCPRPAPLRATAG